MKRIINLSILLLGGIAANATADNCTGDETAVQQDAGAVLSGQRITAIGNGEEWREDHCTNGTLYKVGTGPQDPNSPSVDPRTPKGSWGTNGLAITYSYDNSGPYSFELWRNNVGAGTYYLCGSEVAATITAGPSTIPDPC